ncbi:MAG: hypothetical protein HZA91_10475 [Verrucomicrobia bacterium]|nr:hypothetical protein [Verrucomicrobiota bacterium]
MFCQKCGKEIGSELKSCPHCNHAVAGGNPLAGLKDKTKVASKDALKSLRLLVVNPVGGLAAAFESLDPGRALGVGIAFGVVFVVCVVLGGYMSLPTWIRPNDWSTYSKAIFCAAVSFAGTVAGSALARKLFKGDGGWNADVFTVGASLLPVALYVFIGGVLGFGNYQILLVLGVFAVCLTVMVLHAGCCRILKLSEKAATLAVPLILIVGCGVGKMICAAILQQYFR